MGRGIRTRRVSRRAIPKRRTTKAKSPTSRQIKRVSTAQKRGGAITLRSSKGKIRSGRVQRTEVVKQRGFGSGGFLTTRTETRIKSGSRKGVRTIASSQRQIQPRQKKVVITQQPRLQNVSGNRTIPQQVKPVQFGGGFGTAITNVFNLIEDTSNRSVERKQQLKAEGKLPAQQPRREPIINIDEIFGGLF